MGNYKVLSFGRIPSTQTYAHDLIARGDAVDHTVVTARAQTAGRGRYRRRWVSHQGNLYASFIFTDVPRDGRLAYRVAVAIVDSLRGFGVTAQIKWPNDILVDGKKICGVLIEYNGRFVVIGIGVNIKSSPTVAASYQTTHLDKYANAGVIDVLGALMHNLDAWMDAPFADVRRAWMQNAAAINQMIMYQNQPARLVEIDADGALVLDRDGEIMRVMGDEIVI